MNYEVEYPEGEKSEHDTLTEAVHVAHAYADDHKRMLTVMYDGAIAAVVGPRGFEMV